MQIFTQQIFPKSNFPTLVLIVQADSQWYIKHTSIYHTTFFHYLRLYMHLYTCTICIAMNLPHLAVTVQIQCYFYLLYYVNDSLLGIELSIQTWPPASFIWRWHSSRNVLQLTEPIGYVRIQSFFRHAGIVMLSSQKMMVGWLDFVYVCYTTWCSTGLFLSQFYFSQIGKRTKYGKAVE